MDELAFRSAMVCRVLGNSTRYRILKLLAHQPSTPGQLCEALGKSRTIISTHLAKLRDTGLVRFKRQAAGLVYWPKVRGVARLIAQLERFAEGLR